MKICRQRFSFLAACFYVLIHLPITGSETFEEFVFGHFQQKKVNGILLFLCTEEWLLKFWDLRNELSISKLTLLTFNNDVNVSQTFDTSLTIGVFLDMTCDSARRLLLECSRTYMFSGITPWMVWSTSREETLELFEDINLSVNSDMTLATPGVVLYDIFKIHYLSPLVATEIAVWSPDSSLKLLNPKEDRTDFHRVQLNVTYAMPDMEFAKAHPMEYLMDHNEEHNKLALFRLFFRDWDNLRVMFNMQYIYNPVDSWGHLDASGHFTGSVGQLEKGVAEISLTETAFRMERFGKIEYCHHTHTDKVRLVFLQPRTFGSYKALVIPFSHPVWAVFAFSTLLAISLYRLMAQFDYQSKIASWPAALEQTISLMSQQGLEDLSSLSGRLTSFFFLIFSFMMYNYYNAAILDGILSPSPNTIHGMEDLLGSKLKIILHDAPYARDRKAADGIFGRKSERRTKLLTALEKEGETLYSAKDGVTKVKSGKYAFIISDFILYEFLINILSEKEICESDTVVLDVVHVGMSTRRGSPYRELFSRAFKKMHEAGLLIRSELVWHEKKPECNWTLDYLSLSTESLTVAYLILLTGFAVSLFVLVVEKTRMHFVSSRRKMFIIKKDGNTNTE